MSNFCINHFLTSLTFQPHHVMFSNSSSPIVMCIYSTSSFQFKY